MDDVTRDEARRMQRGHLGSTLAGVAVLIGIAGGWMAGMQDHVAIGLVVIFVAIALAAVGVTVALLSTDR